MTKIFNPEDITLLLKKPAKDFKDVLALGMQAILIGKELTEASFGILKMVETQKCLEKIVHYQNIVSALSNKFKENSFNEFELVANYIDHAKSIGNIYLSECLNVLVIRIKLIANSCNKFLKPKMSGKFSFEEFVYALSILADSDETIDKYLHASKILLRKKDIKNQQKLMKLVIESLENTEGSTKHDLLERNNATRKEIASLAHEFQAILLNVCDVLNDVKKAAENIPAVQETVH